MRVRKSRKNEKENWKIDTCDECVQVWERLREKEREREGGRRWLIALTINFPSFRSHKISTIELKRKYRSIHPSRLIQTGYRQLIKTKRTIDRNRERQGERNKNEEESHIPNTRRRKHVRRKDGRRKDIRSFPISKRAEQGEKFCERKDANEIRERGEGKRRKQQLAKQEDKGREEHFS